jgi:ribulose-5-phosphate 4-epimerase/fuculose-1-phosphate aldolase
MTTIARATKDLVIANRILAMLGIVDAFGDISARHPGEPERFLLARPVSPAAVVLDDIIEFGLDGAPACAENRDLPRERFIHAAIYAARPDVHAILHASPEDLLPFGVAQNTPLRAVIGAVGDMGLKVPVWDIAQKFGNSTDLEVSTLEQARDLARALGKSRVALLRGSGFVAVGRTINDVVRMSAYVPRNGRVIMEAKPFGRIKTISAGESAARLTIDPESNAMRRGWEYWARQAGCAALLAD